MSFGGVSSFARRAGLAIPTPIYADTNDSPIDLRKKVAIRRSRYGYDSGIHQYHSDFSSSDDDDVNDHQRLAPSSIPLSSENCIWTKRVLLERSSYHHHAPAFPTVPNPYEVLSLRNLHPVLSEQYGGGVQYALFASPEGTHVVPVPSHYTSSSPHLRASLGMPDNIKRDYFASEQRQIRDTEEELQFRDLYFRQQQQHSKAIKQVQDSDFHLRDSLSEKHYPWQRSEHVSAFKHLDHSPSFREDRFQTAQKDYHSVENIRSLNKQNNHSSHHRNTYSPQEHQSRQRYKASPVILRRKTRSLSLSNVKKKFPETRNKTIHPGYSSDGELSSGKKSSGFVPAKTADRQFSSVINNRHKIIRGIPVEENESDSDHATRHPKTDRTLLNLLASEPPNYRKKDSDVLLRQLQRSPVNQSAKKDGYPWSVYEYYNHLVEKFRDRSFQRSPTHLRTAYGGSCSPPAPPSSMLVSGLSVDEDSLGNQQRKRPTRALTGKHVKNGTGASPSTLITLRQKIQERQRAKELKSLNMDHHHHQDIATVKIARNGNCKKPKQSGNLKRLKQEQNGSVPLRDLRT